MFLLLLTKMNVKKVETIAKILDAVGSVFNAWMANTLQKNLIIDANMQDIGVGCGFSSDVNSAVHSYWTGVIAKTT